MQFPLPLLTAIEGAINRVLTLDPHSLAAVCELQGQVIELQFEGLNTHFFMLVLEDSVELSRFHDEAPDTTISGSPMALLSMLKNPDALFEGTVTITGDISNVRKLKSVMDNLDVDWEERLAGLIGDTPAHQFFRMMGGVQRTVQTGVDGITQQGSDYLKSRNDLAVNEEEIEGFCASVDDLRSQTDRFEARLSKLETHQQAQLGKNGK